jgi:pSer/pThr/pTyr-binding forkhead associated (FHA) protein
MMAELPAVLVVTEGPLAGKRLEVQSELVIGREDAGLTIKDSEISRRHAAVRLSGERLELEDLGSLNGTFVNGARIASVTALHAGDMFKVGQTSIEVESVPVANRTVLATPATAAPGTRPRPVAPRPAAPPERAPAPAPPQPSLGAFAPATPKRQRATASRQLTPTLLSFGAIAATAAALVVYFAQH